MIASDHGTKYQECHCAQTKAPHRQTHRDISKQIASQWPCHCCHLCLWIPTCSGKQKHIDKPTQAQTQTHRLTNTRTDLNTHSYNKVFATQLMPPVFMDPNVQWQTTETTNRWKKQMVNDQNQFFGYLNLKTVVEKQADRSNKQTRKHCHWLLFWSLSISIM